MKFSAAPSSVVVPLSRETCHHHRFRLLHGLGCCCGCRTVHFHLLLLRRPMTSGDHYWRWLRHCCCVCHRMMSCHGTDRKNFRRGHDGNCRRRHLRHCNLAGCHLPEKNGPHAGASGPVSDDPGYPCTNRCACSGLLRFHFRGACPVASTDCCRTGTSDCRCTSCCSLLRHHRCTGSGSCPDHCSCCFRRRGGSLHLRHHGTSYLRGNFPGCGSSLLGHRHDSSGRNGNSGKPSRKHDASLENNHFL